MFAGQVEAVLGAYSRGLGADPAGVPAGSVTVAERPAQHWGYRVVGASFGDRTLFSVAPEWVDLARELAPDTHHHGVLLDVLSAIRERALADGNQVTLHAPGVCWALASTPVAPSLPPDHRIEVVDAIWLNDLIPDSRFENGAGQVSAIDGRGARNLYGVAVRDPAGEVVALAGAFFTYGLHEIGVDVVAARRGEGLGRSVVSALAREILDRDAIPYYGCNPTNIRSMRTALSVGFLPVCADAAITD